MEKSTRKAAIAAYKERKAVAGIYAVRCLASGQCWVGGTPDLSTIRNRLWFTLRQEASPHRPLQEAWRLHGAGAFVLETVEEMKQDEEPPFIRDRRLRDRRAYWLAALQAAPI